MKWELIDPKYGDIIRVKVGSIYHYGIYADDDTIYQFGLSPALRVDLPDSEVEVCTSDVSTFLCDGFLEVGVVEKKDGKPNPPDKIVELCKSKIGERGYHLLYNNCEHFANLCYFGKKYSSQTDGVRALFRALPLVDVYIAKIPDSGKITKVYPKARQEEIKAVKSDKVRQEKYYAWKLLEYAILQSFNKDIKSVNFTLQDTGKWTSDLCEFSISHSHGVVCVGLSRTAIGVDVELIKTPPLDVSKAILSDSELVEYSNLSDLDKTAFLINAWTKKESLFKKKNLPSLSREEFRALDGTTVQKTISMDANTYSLSIATDNPDKIKIDNVQL